MAGGRQRLRRLGLTAAVLLFLPVATVRTERGRHFPETITCILDVRRSDTGNLSDGLNYEMLRLFAADHGAEARIIAPEEGWSCMDTLLSGGCDILVVPASDSVASPDILVSMPVEGGCRWLVGKGRHGRLKSVNAWISGFQRSKDGKVTARRFLTDYNPYRRLQAGGKVSALSPYDGLIRSHAAAIGWDWRKVAALIYCESKFSISAHSVMGARGLMQLTRTTGQGYGVENPLDPEENIEAGCRLLADLQGRLRPYADSREELEGYALAAYNSGLGNVTRRIAATDTASVAAAKSDSASAVGLGGSPVAGGIEGAATGGDGSTPAIDGADSLSTAGGTVPVRQGYVSMVQEVYDIFVRLTSAEP